MDSGASYAIIGREVGDQGTPHLQGFVRFSNPRSFNSIRGMLLGQAHIERANGDAASNKEYCSKEGDFWEHGECPASQKSGGEAEKRRWTDALSAIKENRLDDVPADIMIRHYANVKKIRKDFMDKPDDEEDVTGLWIWGPPGTGKSYSARQAFPNAYLKPCNKWWDGYLNEDYVILDDFDLNHKVLGHHLKIWADRYAFIGEDKGGGLRIRPKKIIVTSNYPITEIFQEEQLQQAILRRFTVVHKTSRDINIV